MARPKLGEGDTQRLQLKISDEELAAIDDWRFANRVASRSEAVRRLCQIGLQSDARLASIREKSHSARETMLNDTDRLGNQFDLMESFDDVANALGETITAMSDAFERVADLDREIMGATSIADILLGDESIQVLINRVKQDASDHADMMRRFPLKLRGKGVKE